MGVRFAHRLAVGDKWHYGMLAGCLHGRSALLLRHTVKGPVVHDGDVRAEPVVVLGQGRLERPLPGRLVAKQCPH